MSDPSRKTEAPPGPPPDDAPGLVGAPTVAIPGPDQQAAYRRLHSEVLALQDRLVAHWKTVGDTVSIRDLDLRSPVRVREFCQECGGSGFTGYGQGYDNVCDHCSGGPEWTSEALVAVFRQGDFYSARLFVDGRDGSEVVTLHGVAPALPGETPAEKFRRLKAEADKAMREATMALWEMEAEDRRRLQEGERMVGSVDLRTIATDTDEEIPF